MEASVLNRRDYRERCVEPEIGGAVPRRSVGKLELSQCRYLVVRNRVLLSHSELKPPRLAADVGSLKGSRP